MDRESEAFGAGGFDGAELVFCERFTEQSDIWNLERHQHEYVEMLYFLEGGARVHGDDDDLTLSVFDLVVYPEEQTHLETVDLSQRQEIVCIGVALPRPSGIDRIRRLSDLDARLKWPFVELHAQQKSTYPDREHLVGHLLHTLLHCVRQALNDAIDIQDPIRRVIHYLHEHLAEHITVDELADLANCSASYLDRRFKRRTGVTPIKYLENARLDAASRLLLREDMDIARVASLIGFTDPRYFSRRFAARFGVAPSRYR